MDRPLRGQPQVADVVASLLREEDAQQREARLVVFEPGQGVVRLDNGRLVRVFTAPTDESSLHHLVDRCLENNPKSGTEVVFVGGGEELAPWVEEAMPQMRAQPFFVHQLSARWQELAWPSDRGSKIVAALAGVELLDHEGEASLIDRVRRDVEAAHEERGETVRFFDQLKKRPAPVTRALLVAIVAMFGLAAWWSPMPLLELGIGSPTSRSEQEFSLLYAVSMGALWAPSVAAGEWWRLITPGFLHGGLMHLGVNSFVLYVLGSQTEKVIGSARFLWIYTASLIGGSLASTFFTQAVSVGASGAIWGVLGAQAALAYGKPDIMPQSIAKAMRPQAMSNLVLNVIISFAVPGIDWAAHFGGGLAGGLLLASGVLYPSSSRQDLNEEPAFVRTGAQLCVALMFVCVVLALWTGQPWALAQQVGFTSPGTN